MHFFVKVTRGSYLIVFTCFCGEIWNGITGCNYFHHVQNLRSFRFYEFNDDIYFGNYQEV